MAVQPVWGSEICVGDVVHLPRRSVTVAGVGALGGGMYREIGTAEGTTEIVRNTMKYQVSRPAPPAVIELSDGDVAAGVRGMLDCVAEADDGASWEALLGAAIDRINLGRAAPLE